MVFYVVDNAVSVVLEWALTLIGTFTQCMFYLIAGLVLLVQIGMDISRVSPDLQTLIGDLAELPIEVVLFFCLFAASFPRFFLRFHEDHLDADEAVAMRMYAAHGWALTRIGDGYRALGKDGTQRALADMNDVEVFLTELEAHYA